MRDEHYRYCPEWPLPPYIFVPGTSPHPKKAGGHMEGQPDPVSPPIDSKRPELSLFLRYGIDLYHHGYFWESHVYFEALWNAHGRVGSIADFFKGLIKLGAAGVKVQLQQKQNALDHFLRAKELFKSVKEREGSPYLGFNLQDMILQVEDATNNQSKKIRIDPDWQ